MPTKIDGLTHPVCPHCNEPITYGSQSDHDADHAGAERILSIVESADTEDWVMGSDSRNDHYDGHVEFLPAIGFARKQGHNSCGHQLYYMRGGYWPRNNTIKRLSVDAALQQGLVPWSSLFSSIERTRELWPSVAHAVMRLRPSDRRELLIGRPLPKNLAADKDGCGVVKIHQRQPWLRNGSMPVPGWTGEHGGYLHMRAYDAIRSLDDVGALDACLPEKTTIFRAFDLVRPEDVRVVIIGQDPFPDPRDAMGLAFSSRAPKLPASLRNIYAEMTSDVGAAPKNGDLTFLAYQGVLLANAGLTLGADGKTHLPHWQAFTRTWVSSLASQRSVVWILWGKHAQAWGPTIEAAGRRQIIIESVHPSPLSARRGFFGSRPFSRANAGLRELGMPEINWAGSRTVEEFSFTPR